jgi:hypothetical protein
MNARTTLNQLSTIVSPYDFPMEVSFEYDEGESPILWPTELAHPGAPSNVVLLSCVVGGVDLMDMLSSQQVDRIEAAILDQMEG